MFRYGVPCPKGMYSIFFGHRIPTEVFPPFWRKNKKNKIKTAEIFLVGSVKKRSSLLGMSEEKMEKTKLNVSLFSRRDNFSSSDRRNSAHSRHHSSMNNHKIS